MDFQEHTQKHHQIRDALVVAVSERRAVDPPALGSERQCPTGGWLQGEEARRWAGNHAFLGLVEAHRAFHHQVDRVADLTRRGEWADAQKALRTGSPFALALADLTAALRAMRRAVNAVAA